MHRPMLLSAAVRTAFLIVTTCATAAFAGGSFESTVDSIDAALARSDTFRARLFLQQARDLHPRSGLVRFYQARLEVDGEEAARLYKKSAADRSLPDSLRALAFCRLGDYHYVRGDYGDAIEQYHQAADLDTAFARISDEVGKRIIGLRSLSDPASQPAGFTVQVGAFGAIENAQNMKNRLGKSFDTITIVSLPSSSGTMLYRVHVGAFETKEDAADFAEKKITPLGYSYTVVSSGGPKKNGQ